MADQNIDFRLGIQGDQNVVNAFGKVNNSLKQTAESGTRMNMVGMNFNRIVQDSPYFLSSFNMGIMSIGNNIGPLAESFAMAKQRGESFTSVLKSSLSGFGGWMLALNLAVAGVTAFALANRGAKEEVDELAKSLKAMIDLGDPTKGLKFIGDKKTIEASIKIIDEEINKTNQLIKSRQLAAGLNAGVSGQGISAASFIKTEKEKENLATLQKELETFKAMKLELESRIKVADRLKELGFQQATATEKQAKAVKEIKKDLSETFEILSKGKDNFGAFNIGGLTSFGITGERNVPSKPDYSTSLTMEEIQKDFQLQYIGAQNAANAIAGVFNSMWDDIFGTAQGFWSDFFGGMLRDLTSIASKGLMTDLLNLIIPGAGLVGGLFTNRVGGGNITIVNQLGNAELNKVVLKANSDNARLRYAN